MNESKKWYLSKRFWGSIGTIISSVLILAGFDVDTGMVTEICLTVLDVISAIVALYGGLVAQKKITF